MADSSEALVEQFASLYAPESAGLLVEIVVPPGDYSEVPTLELNESVVAIGGRIRSNTVEDGELWFARDVLRTMLPTHLPAARPARALALPLGELRTDQLREQRPLLGGLLHPLGRVPPKRVRPLPLDVAVVRGTVA